MDLSIITVTWNSEKTVTDQIRSVISACNTISFEHIIVDNASSDSTCNVIRSLSTNVRLIENDKNEGFAAANHRGAKEVSGKYILLLNPDMKLEAGSLDRLVAWMDTHDDVAIAGCTLLDEKRDINLDAGPRRFPTVLNQIAVMLKIPHIFPQVLDRYLMRDFDYTKEQDVDSVRGSFLLLRKSFVDELGWVLDPRYVNWFEDVDVCREAKKRGYRVVYTPIVSCIDLVGRSFAQRSTVWKQRQFTRSMLTYFKKWEPPYKWIWIALLRPVGIGLTAVFRSKK